MTTVQDAASRLAGQAGGRTSRWGLGRSGGRLRFTTPAGQYEFRAPVVTPQDTPLMIIGKGAVAGLVGTAIITVLMEGVRTVLGEGESESQQTPTPAQVESRRTEPTDEVVQRVATGVAETRITATQRQVLGTALHWAYGSFWGTIYALAQTTLHLNTALHGTILGLTVWGVGPLSLFPAMRLTPSPTEQSATRTLLMGMVHVVYGWTTAYTFRLLSRDPEV